MNGRLVRLLPLVPASITASSAAGAFPDDNLADPQPKVVWQSAVGAGAVTITIDLGADTSIDTVALLFSTLSADATWDVLGASAAAGVGALDDAASRILGSTGAGPRAGVTSRATRFHMLATGTAVVVRYVRINLNDPTTTTIAAGIAAIGQAWAPFWNYEWGGGRRIDDLSDVQQLDGGELAIWRKAKVPTAKVSWGDMTDAELRALWSILSELGQSEPLLLIEDPDPAVAGLHERIHYGTLVGLDFFERVQANKSRIELKVRQWL